MAWLMGYLSIGLIISLMTITAMRPSGDYRPTLGVLLLALLVFTLFWPALVFLAACYGINRYVNRQPMPHSRRRLAPAKLPPGVEPQ